MNRPKQTPAKHLQSQVHNEVCIMQVLIGITSNGLCLALGPARSRYANRRNLLENVCC
ncbi:hypothetical protein BDV19DRAFT_361046 [Aspergillus venezuelensis]